MSALLKADDVSTGYGKIDIVFGASLEVDAGEIATVIGPNGAGKSTLLKSIAGVLRCTGGYIYIDGASVANHPPSRVAQAGLAYVPQEANVFRQMSVEENLTIGSWVDPKHHKERRTQVLDLFPDLHAKLSTKAGNLSGGQRQMVAFGMALMVAPKVLLLDEPSAGLSPKLVGEMFEAVKKVNQTGVAVLMVEQNAIQALEISDRGIVMAAGEIVQTDEASALLASENISDLFLGTRR